MNREFRALLDRAQKTSHWLGEQSCRAVYHGAVPFMFQT
jgi:hypothetical protein